MTDDLLRELVKEALQNAEENGATAQFKETTLWSQACDMADGIYELEKVELGDIIRILVQVRLEQDPVHTLNKLQSEGIEYHLLDPVHAIQFALQQYEGIEFLRCWNEGDWKSLIYQWPEWLKFKQ